MAFSVTVHGGTAAGLKRAHLLEHGLVVVDVVHSHHNLRRGGQGLWTSGGVVVCRGHVQDVFHPLQPRRRAGTEADQTCEDQLQVFIISRRKTDTLFSRTYSSEQG